MKVSGSLLRLQQSFSELKTNNLGIAKHYFLRCENGTTHDISHLAVDTDGSPLFSIGFGFLSAAGFEDRFLSRRSLDLDGDFLSSGSSGVFLSEVLSFMLPISDLTPSSRPVRDRNVTIMYD